MVLAAPAAAGWMAPLLPLPEAQLQPLSAGEVHAGQSGRAEVGNPWKVS